MNWLFLFLPISIVLERMPGVSSALVFFSAALAIIPVAHTLVKATEQLASYTGEAVGGLLNATFGNAPELIICIVALRAGYLDMVRASIIGAIIANLLLAQGLSFLLGGIRYHNQTYNANATRVYSSIMMMAIISLAIPSIFAGATKINGSTPSSTALDIAIAVMLLVAYGLYLVFMLRTHPDSFASANENPTSDHSESRWSLSRSLVFLIGASVLAAFVSEILVGAAEGTGKALGVSDVFLGIICLAVIGGAAEIASAIVMACNNKMDLSIGISLGSSIQIALFVAPMLVLCSFFMAPVPISFTFESRALIFLLLVVLIGGMVVADGRANWYKGAQLLIVYIMFATMVYLVPSAHL